MERSVYGSGHLSMASGIGRATEHEVMRSITEGEEVRRMTVKGADHVVQGDNEKRRCVSGPRELRFPGRGKAAYTSTG